MADEATTTSVTVRWLEPGQVQARWEPEAARLSVRIDGGDEIADAQARQAFPTTRADGYVEISDAKSKSLGILEGLKDLDAGSRQAIGAALEVRYLIPQITRVIEMTEYTTFVIRWRAETTRGERLFQTESVREAVHYLGPERIRVTDLAGNYYDIPNLSGLDEASRAILGRFL